MLELAYIRTENDSKKEEHPIDSVIRYIKRYHTQPITLADACAHLSYSRSYISHAFKQYTGISDSLLLLTERQQENRGHCYRAKQELVNFCKSVDL